MLSRKNDRRILYAYYGLFVPVMLFLFWKCRFGCAFFDEPLALVIPYRLCRGDCLLTQEWHVTQLSAFPLFPAMKLYLSAAGGTEGIVLHFRYLYTAVWGLAACFFFHRLSRFDRVGAACASLAFLLYAPFGIMTLDYNSLGILFLLNAGILACTQSGNRASCYVLSGLFLAGAVLCCPYLVLLYALFTLVAIVWHRWKNGAILRAWLFVSVGCALLLAVFLAFLLSRTSFDEIRRTLPVMLTDPEHPGRNLFTLVYGYGRELLLCCRMFVPGMILFSAALITALCARRKKAGFVLSCLAFLLMEVDFLLEEPYLNLLMFPINLPGLYCAICSCRKEVRLPFFCLWLPGGVYTFCIHMASNQGFYAIASASTVMSLASCVMIAVFVREELSTEKKQQMRTVMLLSMLLLFTFQLTAEAEARYQLAFNEKGMPYLTQMATSGPEKGIIMSPERYEIYMRYEADVQPIRIQDDIEKVLFFSTATHLYLSAEKDVAAYSSWLSGVNSKSLDRLEQYYELFPNKRPDAVYLEKKDERFAEYFYRQGYQKETLPSGAFLLRPNQ